MRKFLPITLIVIGAAFFVYAIGQFAISYFQQEAALAEAKKFVSDVVVERDKISPEIAVYNDIEDGDRIGILYIPRLDREIPIISGTDEEELSRGVGHYKTTALPGQQNQILLSGHRDTVFRQFGELEHGDEFHVKMANGTYIYTIYDTEIVDADDRTVIRSTAPDEILTLSTCYPFSYIGSAPDRYIIYAK